MTTRSPVESLNPNEAEQVKRVIAEHGMMEAAHLLGLRTKEPLAKAAAGLPVHTLTASTIRAKLVSL